MKSSAVLTKYALLEVRRLFYDPISAAIMATSTAVSGRVRRYTPPKTADALPDLYLPSP